MTPEPIEKLFGLFTRWGECNYIGEKVTQLQHAQQVRSYSGLHQNEQSWIFKSFQWCAKSPCAEFQPITAAHFTKWDNVEDD